MREGESSYWLQEVLPVGKGEGKDVKMGPQVHTWEPTTLPWPSHTVAVSSIEIRGHYTY